jgi:hypothetical protein
MTRVFGQILNGWIASPVKQRSLSSTLLGKVAFKVEPRQLVDAS